MKRPFRASLSPLLFVVAATAAADDFNPVYVEIAESADYRFSVRIRLPPRVPAINEPAVQFPAGCAGQTSGLVHCSDDPAGKVLELVYPLVVPQNSTVVRFLFATGEQHTMTLSSGELDIPMPDRESVTSVATQYTWLGMEHIWVGFDHLLFVLCLIWIARTWQRVLVTITGFTIAHSVTLALAALDVLRLPVAPIEAVIALSVLFLATELARGDNMQYGGRHSQESESLTWRYPVTVSSTFGLLHGLGFAAVLDEIGLPQLELMTGLVFFNVGVELSQVVFAAFVMALLSVLRRWPRFALHGHIATAYAVGTLAAYWLIERTASFFV